jgi:hypothetical protein
MDDKTTAQPDASAKPDYERLCIDLYTYRFGAITFIELIERLEIGLGLSHQTEVLHLDSSLDESECERRRSAVRTKI